MDGDSVKVIAAARALNTSFVVTFFFFKVRKILIHIKSRACSEEPASQSSTMKTFVKNRKGVT